ncbi:MAG TPA: non-canonical purine NTP pyrophosphatase, RdgB/HAM1 family [Solibacterales bacterium]|nr:non-canonical purine NTP pyrophosphatase, RdgB/HAM1 family [Bryobacterales bacterium]
MTLFCATSNPGKRREFQLAGAAFGIEVLTIPQLNEMGVAPETGETFEANAAEKALYYAARTGGYVFVDDSGLEVDALGGEPGVYSARYAGEGATDAMNNALLLERLQGVRKRAARFVCVIALARGERITGLFRGEVQGAIVEAPRGAQGFGYDPLFYYPGFDCTFGEVDAERKMTVSHRGRALEQLFRFAVTLPD